VVVTAPQAVPFQGTFESQAGPAGGILLDAEVYACSAEVGIKVADSHLTDTETLDIGVTTSGEDRETVTLLETPAGTGVFVGGIAAASGAVETGDGTLQMTDGVTITVQYNDEDDGADNTAVVQDTAVVDCQPPVFDGLVTAEADRDSAQLEWAVAADSRGWAIYNVYRDQTSGGGIGSLIGTTSALSFADYGCDPGQTCHYIVRSQDAVGNEDENTVELSATIPIPGDVDGNCEVDVTDVQETANRWRLRAPVPLTDAEPETISYETRFDLDWDGDVDTVDIMAVVARWGESGG